MLLKNPGGLIQSEKALFPWVTSGFRLSQRLPAR